MSSYEFGPAKVIGVLEYTIEMRRWTLGECRHGQFAEPAVAFCSAVRRHLVFAGSHSRYAVLPHQSTDPAVTGIQADLLQLFGHPWPTIAAQAEA